MNQSEHNQVEIVIVNAEGTTETLLVTPLEENLFFCQRSLEFSTDFRILHGDIFEGEKLDSGRYRLVRMVTTGAMRHFKADLGLYMLPPSTTGRNDLKEKAFDGLREHFDDVFITDALKEFLDHCDGYWELDEFFQFYNVTVHLPDEQVNAFFERLPELCPQLKPEQFKEIFTGECDD
ncbi:MAG: hypothetical protein K2W92_02440 [Alphaproteobacteria bacterium]|nr:hypothetical protein [Burkholderiaceae bacterium]MBY0292129.1 hypothetical protein [Alphaproteobacteria bacterium]